MEDRIFKSVDKDGKEVDLKFKRPNQMALSKGDFVYRKEFSNAVRAGIMTSAEANKLLKDRGIWDEEKEAQEVSLRKEVGALERKFKGETPPTEDEGLELREKLKKLRVELAELTAIYSSIVDSTAESVASEMRTQFFASECVVYKDSGKRVFKSLDEFRERMDERLVVDSYRQALISNWEQSLGIAITDEATKALPEDEWLATVEKEKVATSEPEEVKPARKSRKKKEEVATVE